MKALVIQQTEDPDERGPDLLKGVKVVNLVGLTPNQVRALLLLFNRVSGDEDSTLRGEITTMHFQLLKALGVPYEGTGHNSLSPAQHHQARRYLGRDDLAQGDVRFYKGGAHV